MRNDEQRTSAVSFLKNRTLRSQLTRASLLTTLAALALSTGLILFYEFFSYRDERASDLQAQADLLAHSVAPALVFNDKANAAQQLATLRDRKGFQAVAVFDKDGAVFSQLGMPSVKGRLGDARSMKPGHSFSGSDLELVHPIDYDGERIGSVYLHVEHDVWSRVANYAVLQLGAAALAMLLAYLIFSRLQKTVTQPLEDVTRVAREVVFNRDWNARAPSTSVLDLAILVDAFNRMLDEVKTRTDELRNADAQKDVFLATLAHELRNPLAPMSNAVMLLSKGDLPQPLRDKSLGILERQLRHIVRLIDDLLDVSRISTGKLVLKKELVDLNTVLRAAIELIEPNVASGGLKLQARIPSGSCMVIGDRTRLLQVFSNLLSNASRYTPAGGLIEVSLVERDGAVDVRVRDTGIGVEPAMQGQIFELFQQADKSLERGSAGLGIGLTLALRLAQLHGGEISLHSDGIGRGSTFTVSLPKPSGLGQEIDELVYQAPATARPLRLIVADDNVDAAQSLEALLQTMGHQVVVANDGVAALSAALASPPDALLLDIGMPGLNGYEVAKRIRNEIAGRPRLIALTGWGQQTDRARAVDAGFDQHLVKPVSLGDLMNALAKVEVGHKDAQPEEGSQ
jgi:signal transduction histidine kinase/ActR/RegA family two-component response regulator